MCRRSRTVRKNGFCSVAWIMFFLFFVARVALAQGGPPFHTNDPGTPGNLNWEINLGFMPSFYSDHSNVHAPDIDINFGIGKRVQLTYVNAWLRVQDPEVGTKFGLGQSNPGVKWRFYDAGENGFSLSVFPQLFLNNPNSSVERGVAPPENSFLLPVQFSRKFGPVHVDGELGYQFVLNGPNQWLTGLMVGRKLTKKLELGGEIYATGSFHPPDTEPTVDFGARYRLHDPVILLMMAGRSFEPRSPEQSYFIGYFGVQILLPRRAYKR